MLRRANRLSVRTIVLPIGLLAYCTTVQTQILTHNLQGTNVNSLIALEVTDILLATSRGLLRFDGKKFEEFPMQVSGRMLLPTEIVDIVCDNDRNIWVARINESGTNELYVREDFAWKFLDKSSGAPEAPINDLFVDSYGRVWLGTKKEGITIFIGKDKHRINKTNYEIFQNGSWILKADLRSILPKALEDIRTIEQDKSGGIWLGTDGGVIQFSSYRGILDSAAVADPDHWKHFLEIESILAIRGDNQGGVWIGTLENGVFHFESTGNYQNFKPGVILGGASVLGEEAFLDWNRIKTIEQDKEDNLWMGTAEGVCRFNPNAQSSNNLWRFMGPDVHSSFRVGIETIFNDFDNNLWFGLSTGQGLLRFNNNWFTFGVESLGDFPFVKALLVNNKDVWVGTSNGIVRMRGENPLQTMRAGDQNQIWSLTSAKDSQVWVGTFGDGVFLYDENGIQLYHLDTMGQPDEMGNTLIDTLKRVTQIIERHDEVWIATLAGLSRFSLVDSSWTNYTATPGGLISNEINSLAFDDSGKLWCGTAEGVSVLNPDSDKWEPPITANNGLSNKVVTTIASHPSNNEMWLGTDGGGISVYSGTRWKHLTHPDLLADNVINQIVFSQNGEEVWVATPDGVSRRDKKGIWESFTSKSGLASNFVQAIALQGDSLRWFGTWGSGLTRYRPPQSLPETFIDSRLDVTDKAEVTYHFSAADLNTAQDEFRFQYWIDTQEPSEPTADRFAVVAVPEPVTGPHTFFVRAIDRDGNYDREPARDYFYRIDPRRGGYSTFVDKTSFSKIDSVVIKVYWPPDLLAGNTEIIIAPANMSDLDSLMLFAFDLNANNMTILKPITLEFIFSMNAATRSKSWGIFAGTDENFAPFGGTTKIVNDKFIITTAIEQLGRYSVREIKNGFNPKVSAEFTTDIQPRMFSPKGGGYGGTTTLSFNLKQSAEVRIKVYNLAGRLVDTICDQQMRAGINAVAWDGEDMNGQICPTGLYIVTIESDIMKAREIVMIVNK